ncbi:MAG: hypothetical protein U0Z53_01515 [Blastocatellia bacterium]
MRMKLFLILPIVIGVNLDQGRFVQASLLQKESHQKTLSKSTSGQFATKLVARWHETLDVKTLFTEQGVQSALLKTESAKAFQGYYQFVYGLADDEKFAPDVDEALMREGLYAFLNNLSLQAEIMLAHSVSLEEVFEEPVEIKKATENLAAVGCKGTINRQCLDSYIAAANKLSDLRRQLLPKEIFQTAKYLRNQRQVQQVQKQTFGKGSLPLQNLPTTVKQERFLQGVFDFVFVEESSERRLYTILFDP